VILDATPARTAHDDHLMRGQVAEPQAKEQRGFAMFCRLLSSRPRFLSPSGRDC
jgi:hypothetical protein